MTKASNGRVSRNGSLGQSLSKDAELGGIRRGRKRLWVIVSGREESTRVKLADVRSGIQGRLKDSVHSTLRTD